MTRSNKKNRSSKPGTSLLATSVRAYILANTGRRKRFPPIDDGNRGVCAYIASEKSGAAMLDLAKDLCPGVPIALSFVFDPDTHSVIAVVTSDDEPHLHLVVLDRVSGKFTPITEINVVDLPGASEAVFARCFAGVTQEDVEWGGLMTKLLGDGQYLSLGKGGARDLWWT